MSQKNYPSLSSLNRDFLSTNEAAFYLNRTPQTLRLWAKKGGVISPLRIHSRLAWPLEAIKTLLGGSHDHSGK